MKTRTFLPIILFLLLSGFSTDSQTGTLHNQYNKTQQASYKFSDVMDLEKSIFEPKKGQAYLHLDTRQSPNDLKSMEFTPIKNKHRGGFFAAYLVNNSDTTFTFISQDGSLVMIQEALNEEGEWQPIEHWVPSRCGNSYFDRELEPGKFVLVPIKKYSGNFKTKIRLKLRTGNKLFYSEPFKGWIDQSQFEKETEMVEGVMYRGKASYLD